MHRFTLLGIAAFLTMPLPSSGDEVDEAIASLKQRGAALTLVDDRKVDHVGFSATPLAEEDIKNLSTLRAARGLTAVTLRGNDFGDRDAEMLSQIKGLRTIGLLKTRATQVVIDKLHKAYADLRIVYSGGPYLGLALTKDVKVIGFLGDSTAKKAGVLVGDRIMKFDGQKITEVHDLLKLASRSKPGDIVDVEILRGEQSQSLMLTVRRLVVR